MSNARLTLLRLSNIGSLLFTLLLSINLLSTFVSIAPIEDISGTAIVHIDASEKILMESRSVTGLDSSILTITRELYSKTDESRIFIIEGGITMNKQADYVLMKSVILPVDFHGEWCSRLVVYWHPLFSWKDHFLRFNDICFEVPK